MRYASVCSGIEAASAAWDSLVWEAAFFSEIDAFPCSLLAHRYPETPNLGDMTKYKEWPDDAAIDVLVGGTPCQSFSVAGLRKGLDDPRGNLMLTFGAIAAKYSPQWLVWENVPGVLSSNGGRDFGTFLGMLGQLGYGFAYRVLDAQHFGVAQRRRRVFVVGCLRDWRSAAAVLFERDSLQGNPAPSREARQEAPRHAECGFETAGTLDARTRAGGLPGSDGACMGHVVPILAFNVHENQRSELTLSETAGSIKCAGGKPGQGYPAALTVSLRGRDGGATAEMGGEVATALRASTGGGDKPHVLAVHGTQDPDIRLDQAHTLGRNNGGENAVLAAMRVRRLTPVECERLQGFPDDWTDVPHRGKPAADGPRYKALGNSMAVPVMRWIGERIQAVEMIRNGRKETMP